MPEQRAGADLQLASATRSHGSHGSHPPYRPAQALLSSHTPEPGGRREVRWPWGRTVLPQRRGTRRKGRSHPSAPQTPTTCVPCICEFSSSPGLCAAVSTPHLLSWFLCLIQNPEVSESKRVNFVFCITIKIQTTRYLHKKAAGMLTEHSLHHCNNLERNDIFEILRILWFMNMLHLSNYLSLYSSQRWMGSFQFTELANVLLHLVLKYFKTFNPNINDRDFKIPFGNVCFMASTQKHSSFYILTRLIRSNVSLGDTWDSLWTWPWSLQRESRLGPSARAPLLFTLTFRVAKRNLPYNAEQKMSVETPVPLHGQEESVQFFTKLPAAHGCKRPLLDWECFLFSFMKFVSLNHESVLNSVKCLFCKIQIAWFFSFLLTEIYCKRGLSFFILSILSYTAHH